MRASSRIKMIFVLALMAVSLAPRAKADLVHWYDLTDSFDDILGGPSLTHSGPQGPSGYDFLAGAGGLTLSGALTDPATYTIQMYFQLDTASNTNPWSNVLNFHNTDDELYVYCGESSDGGLTDPCTLQLYPSAGTGGILSGVFTDMIFSRDGSTDTVQAWLDGVQILADLDDSTGRGIFSDTDNIIRFFTDDPDICGPGCEDADGTVRTIKIFDQVYTPEDIPTDPPAPVPEPATLTLLGTGTLALINKLRKRQTRNCSKGL